MESAWTFKIGLNFLLPVILFVLYDTLARMPSTDAATLFLTTLHGLHLSLTFTMELPVNGRIPFFGIEIIKNGIELETRIRRKSTNTGLLLHFPSHNDKRYKDSSLRTVPTIVIAHTFYASPDTRINKLTSVFHASVLLLIMNFEAIAEWIRRLL